MPNGEISEKIENEMPRFTTLVSSLDVIAIRTVFIIRCTGCWRVWSQAARRCFGGSSVCAEIQVSVVCTYSEEFRCHTPQATG